MMLNKKAQALVEFILVLPVIILIILGSIDILNIVIKKNELENKVSDQIILFQSNQISIEELEQKLKDNNTKVNINANEESFITIEVKEKVTFITPIVSNILSPFSISTKRVVAYE